MQVLTSLKRQEYIYINYHIDSRLSSPNFICQKNVINTKKCVSVIAKWYEDYIDVVGKY